MSNSIYDPYDFTVNTLRDNDIRENIVQDALVRLLQAFGFDLDRNANVFLSLAASLTKTPDQILTDLKAAGSKNQVVTIDKGNNKLVLIDPVKSTITALEALSNTFSNLVLGITKYTPISNYSLRVIPGTGTGQPTLGLTDSSGVEHLIATQTDYIALKADITILETDIADLKNITTQLAASIASLSSGSGNSDVIESIYYYSLGSSTNDGRTPDKPVPDLNQAITKAIALRAAASQNGQNAVHILSVGKETNREITGNSEWTSGKIHLQMERMNGNGLILSQNIVAASTTTNLNTTSITLNSMHNNARIIVNVDTSAAASVPPTQDDFNLYVTLHSLEIDSSSANPFILVRKKPGATGETSCVKILNIILDIGSIEELCVIDGDTAAALVAFDQTGISFLETHVIINNKYQDISGVTQSAVRVAPFQLTGTATASDPSTLSVSAILGEDRSALYDFSSTVNIKNFSLRLPSKTLLQALHATAQLTIPQTSTSVPNSIFTTTDGASLISQAGVELPLATKAYVDKAITINSTENMDAVSFDRPIKIDPLAQVLLYPDLIFDADSGRDYHDLASIDTLGSFTILSDSFGFRIRDLTKSGTTPPVVFPRQLLLDEWTGTGTQEKAFYGIARIKLLDTTVTVTDNVANTTDIEYTISFTSTISLVELNRNLLPGLWIELSKATDNKLVVCVLSSVVTPGSGANTFITHANICFSNSKRPGSFYTLAELTAKDLSIFLCPFPWVYAQEMRRFRPAVANSAFCHVQMHYYLCALHSADVIEEALLLIPYSASYKALSNKATDVNWDNDIGKVQFSIGNSVPKIIIEKFKTVWAETKLKVGFVPMFIPSCARDGDGGQSLIGLVIECDGSRLRASLPFSERPTSPLYYNMPSFWSGLSSLPVDPTTKTIPAGLQLSSFVDGNSVQLRTECSVAGLDVRLLVFDGGTIDDASVLAAYHSSASSLFGTANRAVVLDDDVLKIISVYSSTTSQYRPFSNVFITPSTGAYTGITIYITGWTTCNSIVQHHRLYLFSSPDSAPPEPTDAEILVIGNFLASEAIGNKGYFIKTDGTAIGHLVNT